MGIDLREQLLGLLLDGLVGVAAVHQILQQGAIRRRWTATRTSRPLRGEGH